MLTVSPSLRYTSVPFNCTLLAVVDGADLTFNVLAVTVPVRAADAWRAVP
jgi:hypothetical protein